MDDQNDTCPICSGNNQCGASYENEGNALRCWCNKAVVPEELIKTLPPHLKGTSCICQSCVERFERGEINKAQLFLKFNTHT